MKQAGGVGMTQAVTTRDRVGVVALATGMNLLCYADRVCISVAAPLMRQEFGLSPSEMGTVFGIFSLAYALGQAPWGLVAERLGTRVVVTFAVLAWSVFTALTGLAQGLMSLLGIRFVFGGLEAAFSPAVAAGFRRWIPDTERAAAFGVFLGGGRLGAAVTPALTALLLARFGWRGMFYCFGVLGLLGALLWWRAYRDRETVQETHGGEVEWDVILRSGRFWSLLGVAFGATFLWQFYITWFPTYLMEARKMSLAEASVYSGLPFLLGLGSTWIGGALTSLLGQRMGASGARRVIGLISLVAASVLLSAGLWLEAARPAALLMACAAGAVDLYLGAAWAVALEIGGKYGSTVAGLMNGASNGAAFLSPIVVGWILQTYGGWNAALSFSVGTTLVAAVLWTKVNARS